MCVLVLRGAQTAAEVRMHCQRIHSFEDVAATERVLGTLAQPSRGPCVAQLARQPGRRERRYAHLLCGPPTEATEDPSAPRPSSARSAADSRCV